MFPHTDSTWMSSLLVLVCGQLGFNCVLIINFLLWQIFLTFFFASGSNGMLFGSGDINVPQDKEYGCKMFPLDPEFNSNDVRVQLAVSSKKYDAAVTWIGSVTKSG